MPLTSEERKNCTDIFFDFTGGDTEMPEHRWNEKAAVGLYHLIAEVKNCSTGMSYITSLPVKLPTSSVEAFKTAIKYISEVAQAREKIRRSSSSKAMSSICVTTKTAAYKSLIKSAAIF